MSESTTVADAESTNTADADDTETMTPEEERDSRNLRAIQHVMKLVEDKNGKTLGVLQHTGVNEPSGSTLLTDKETRGHVHQEWQEGNSH